ncbi:MAG: DEAD/DEAH box helicase family protein [Clostridia bacterium]|nr:DEAD/DEAH box helicase family protein [Clostridia bacterium]
MVQNTDEDNLSPKKPYLGKVLDLEALRKGRANIIIAPCHSGKTTAACKIMERHARSPGHVLYLIDTRAGKDALILKKKAQPCSQAWVHLYDPHWWGDRPDRVNFAVMTYHQFGYALLEEPSFLIGIDLIICDEIHNLVKYTGIEASANEQDDLVDTPEEQTCCKQALESLGRLSALELNGPMIVMLTATPTPITRKFDAMHVPYECMDYYGKVYEDETFQRIYYADITEVISRINGKTLIYVPTIELMKAYAELAREVSPNVVCLWSIHSSKELDEEQLKARESILRKELIPKDVDVLLINAAYETSLNINNEDFRTMIIHCSNPDTQIQVRGRIRHDIDALYLLDKQHEHISSYFPKIYLDKWLPTDLVHAITEEMNLRSEKGRELKWPSLKKLLEKDGYLIYPEKHRQQRGWRIHRFTA